MPVPPEGIPSGGFSTSPYERGEEQAHAAGRKGVRAVQQNLTEGPVTRSMLLFALPMILGNLLQQLYNVADTLIVGRCLGPDALAAVGSSYSPPFCWGCVWAAGCTSPSSSAAGRRRS